MGRIFSDRTSGGIPVLVEKIPDCGSAGFMIGVATGSRDEHVGISGISHLLEHTVFRETGEADSVAMAKIIEGAGGELNAYTGREETAFHAVTIAETADVAMKLVGDIVADPLISEHGTELEKKIVLQELSMIENDPETRIHDLIEAETWRGHPLDRDEGGDPETVAGLTSKDLRSYYEEKYLIPNLAVFAAGNTDCETVTEWAESVLDCRSGGKRNVRTPPERPKSSYRYAKTKTEHLQIAIAFPAYGAEHPDRAATAMLSAVLGSGTSSRLFRSVREEKALVYSVYTSVGQYSDAGSVRVFMSCTEKNAALSLKTAASEFGKLFSDGLEKGELERAKNLVKGASVRAAESTEQRLYRLCTNYMLDGSALTLDEALAEIEGVTEEDVMRVVSDILSPDTMNIVVLGKAGREIAKADVSDFAFL